MTIENDSKFLNIHPDVCEITAPKEKEKDPTTEEWNEFRAKLGLKPV